MERYSVHDEYMTPSEHGNVVLYADAQRALDAEREKVKGLKKRLAEEHPGLDEVCDERDALRAQLAAGRPTPRRNDHE